MFLMNGITLIYITATLNTRYPGLHSSIRRVFVKKALVIKKAPPKGGQIFLRGGFLNNSDRSKREKSEEKVKERVRKEEKKEGERRRREKNAKNEVKSKENR